MAFVENYLKRFEVLPPLEITPNVTDDVEEHETEDCGCPEIVLVDTDQLSELDRVIFQLKLEKHPHSNISSIGLFAVVVQSQLKHYCLADIENRVRQLQMNGWRTDR